MKSSFWVLCGVVLLCFGSVKCKRHFSDNDDNFLDKTGEGDKIRTEKEEDTEWQLYKARTTWNDLTNEIEELSRVQRDDDDDACADFVCYNGGKCEPGPSGGAVCNCKSIEGYTGEKCEQLEKEKCAEMNKTCDETEGTCTTLNEGTTINCVCPQGKEYKGNNGCQDVCADFVCYNGGKCEPGPSGGAVCNCEEIEGYIGEKCEQLEKKKCAEMNKTCDETEGTCTTLNEGTTINCVCPQGKEYKGNNGCQDVCADFVCYNDGKCEPGPSGGAVCNCENIEGYTGEKCEQLEKDDCAAKNKICDETGGTCTTIDKGTTINCVCPQGKEYNGDNGCQVDYCEEKCGGETDTVKCEGDKFTEDKVRCECKKENDEFDPQNKICKTDYCKAKCGGETDKVKCEGDKFTQDVKCGCKNENDEFDAQNKICKTDYCKAKCGGETDKVKCEGDKFTEDVKCGCKNENDEFDAQNKICKKNLCSSICGEKSGVKCEGDKTSETEIQCNCENENLLFEKESKECKENLCSKICGDKPGVICEGVKTDESKIRCNCQNKSLVFDKESKECKDKCDILKCFNDGECKNGACVCKDGYTGKNCEILSDAKCKEQLESCEKTKGKCISDEDGQIECKCPINKKFKDDEGCKENFCKAVCGDKEEVTCGGDETNRDKVICTCDKEGKAFDKVAKDCKDDKCFTVCGIAHTEKDGDVKCANGPFGNVQCGCKEAKNAFDPKDKECKTDYCKEKCGGETTSTRVKCKGNIFEESEMVCNCKYENEDFNSDEKKCQINYCKKVCGTGDHIKCEGDEYKVKEQKDCSCDDDEYLYIKGRQYCQKKCSDNNECKYNGTCKRKDDKSKLCNCVYGTTGDTCDVITACETGKYVGCKGSRGECTFEGGKPTCKCPDGKDLYNTLGYCEDKCKEDKSCEGNNRVCNSDNFCVCQDGYEGEDCNVVSGCKTLKEKCDEIKTECVFNKDAPGKATCQCKNDYIYDRDNNKCKNPFCFPSDPCTKPAVCSDDEATGIGFCKCPDETYYNYRTTSCENLADKCLLKKTSCGEYEECKKGKCECKYKKEKEGDECKPKFCTPNPCFPNANCSESDGSCFCAEGKYYSTNKRCEKAKCSLTEYKTNCSCPSEMERKEGSSDCVPKKDEVKACDQDCGYGLCISKKDKKSCKCFTDIAVDDKGKCVLKSSFCAGGKLQDGKMKCKCEGQFTQAEDGVTCRLKTCEDDDAKKDCASKGGVCKMLWKGKGYDCECPKGYLLGDNGKCRDPCSIEKNIEECSATSKFCYNDISSRNAGTFKCGCPPAIKGDACSAKAENAYIIKNIPVLKKEYETKSGINKVLLNVDLVKSMELTFSNALFESGYLYDYRVGDSVLNCSVWINFKREPSKAELNAMKLVPRTFSKLCDDCDDSAVVWPPSLLLSEKGLQEAVPDKLEFCSNEVKDLLCGKGAKCEKNKCTCDEGFKIIEYSFKKIATFETRRCEDIDECALGIDVCSKNKNTICVNTFGSYKCVCKEGFKKKETPKDPETDQSDCYDMCSPSPCIKGECLLKNKTFDCKCQTGVTGSFCDRADEDYKSAKKGTVVVGAVLGTLLAVIVLGVLFYIIKKKKRSGSEDFMPAPRLDHAEMAERRGMRGVSNKAYE